MFLVFLMRRQTATEYTITKSSKCVTSERWEWDDTRTSGRWYLRVPTGFCRVTNLQAET